MKPDEVGVLFPRSDAEIISDMVRWWKQQSGKPTPLSPPLLPQAPEVYIAKTPTAGIPSRTDGPGTGTDESVANVNFADCDLYRIDHRTNSDIDVEPIGVSRPIYNLGSTNLPGNSLILAIRDKAGKFLAVDLASDEADPCSIRCGWVAGLLTTDCLNGTVVSAGGRCEADTDTAWDAEFEWNGTDEVWDSDPLLPLEIGNVNYFVHFLRDHDPDGSDPSVGGDPQLYLTLASGSGSTKWWATLDCCGEDYAIFAIGGAICTGTTTCGEAQPSANIVRIRVEYQQCTSAGTSGWNGPGWYCVTELTSTGTVSEGPNHGDTAASTATSMLSLVEWTTPSNACATDTVVTTATGPGIFIGAATRTQALDVTDFDFSSIAGELTQVAVTVRRSNAGGMSPTNVVDFMVCLIVDGTAVTSVNKADTMTNWPSSLGDATYTFNASDIVSTGLTLAKLKQSNFGVRVQADGADGAFVANVDSIKVTATAEREPCDFASCVYLAEDPGVCDESWVDYFAICSGPYPTQALCSELCSLPDPDDEPPPDPADAPCQTKNLAGATCTISNASGALEYLNGASLTVSSSGVDLVLLEYAPTPPGATVASISLVCSGGQYVNTGSGPITGYCGSYEPASVSPTNTIVYFNADPWIMVIDSTGGSWGSCGAGSCRFTITVP